MHSNSSTAADMYIAHLEKLSRFISIFASLFYLIIGNVGNLVKVLFFLQKPLRSCPCTVYMLAATISNFIIINNIPMLKLISNLYPSNKWIHMTFGWSLPKNTTLEESFLYSQTTINLCKSRNYLHMWSADVSCQLLLFASFNRFCMSLKRRNREKNHRLSDFFCRFSVAYKMTLFTSVLWALISLHHLFNITVTSNACIPQNILLWSAWISGVHCCILSGLMVLFSALTLINMRKSSAFIRRFHNRDNIMPILMQTRQHYSDDWTNSHRVEAQITSMIIMEIVVRILTALPNAGYVMFRFMTAAHERSATQMARENLIELFVRITMYFESSCGFYIYFFTLTTLRQRFCHSVLQKMRCHWDISIFFLETLFKIITAFAFTLCFSLLLVLFFLSFPFFDWTCSLLVPGRSLYCEGLFQSRNGNSLGELIYFQKETDELSRSQNGEWREIDWVSFSS